MKERVTKGGSEFDVYKPVLVWVSPREVSVPMFVGRL